MTLSSSGLLQAPLSEKSSQGKVEISSSPQLYLSMSFWHILRNSVGYKQSWEKGILAGSDICAWYCVSICLPLSHKWSASCDLIRRGDAKRKRRGNLGDTCTVIARHDTPRHPNQHFCYDSAVMIMHLERRQSRDCG